MRNRILKPAGAPSGVRGLLRFWAIMLAWATACVALLQTLGAPAQKSVRISGQIRSDGASASSSPASPNTPARAGVEGQRRLPPGPEPEKARDQHDPAPSPRTRDDLALRTLSTKLRLYEMARAAADSGKFDQADRFLGLASRLPHVDVETSASEPARPSDGNGKLSGPPPPVKHPADASQTIPTFARLPEAGATRTLPAKLLINEGDTPARPNPRSRNATPAYPEIARQRAEEGLVVLRVLVGTNGLAQAISVAQSSGFADLDTAALASVRGWAFVPAAHAGTPVQASTEVTLRFRLVDSD